MSRRTRPGPGQKRSVLKKHPGPESLRFHDMTVSLSTLHIVLDDPEQIARSPGIEMLSEPTDCFLGAREAAMREPAGNTIRSEHA
jgi:hypothetical protein